ASVTTSRHPRRLAVVIGLVAAAGIAAFAAALASLAGSHLGAGTGLGLVLFVAAMMLADRFPVPLAGVDPAGFFLSFVFGVAALVGPLLAIALYQRSTHSVLRATRLALTDPLTGLGNHRHFHERLREEVLDAQRQHRQLALCLADIDDFKLVNDRFGHPAGDRVLAEVAARLRQGG